MDIYWYWPFARPEDLVVPAAVPLAGDRLVLHAMPGRIPPDLHVPRLEIRTDLPGVGDERERSLRWAAARTAAYAGRSRARRRAVRRERFDICHVVFLNYFTDWLDLRALARRAALVYEVHDVVPHLSRLPSAVERRVLHAQYHAPGELLVRHAYVGRRLTEEWDVDPDRVHVVEQYVRDLGALPRSRPNERRNVLFFGTMRRNKGVATLLEAIELLRDRADVTFRFAGRGAPDVEDMIRSAAARDARIEFECGYVAPDRKDACYAEADVVVLPYAEFASMSAVLADAYAHATPVVVSDVGALGEAVRGDSTGWVVPPSDAAALAAGLAQALADEDGWAAASRAAASVAAERTPQRTADKLRAIYARAVTAGR